MKEVKETFYECDFCGETLGDKEDAFNCESKCSFQMEGIRIGDKIRISTGTNIGEEGTVSDIFVPSKVKEFSGEFWYTPNLMVKLDSGDLIRCIFDGRDVIGGRR